ncbi:hypothetical protein ES332_A01G240300v1 [Gossypium tomentosum]|uniref:Uncharacterized protein n=1 Tax=Gossypium tomentosum TaxID=34277 RepID=A0A5D2RVC1_GOSTO|nr:hypothetical protein ES332_A01G240300v1 [Gossypium tomentosum]
MAQNRSIARNPSSFSLRRNNPNNPDLHELRTPHALTCQLPCHDTYKQIRGQQQNRDKKERADFCIFSFFFLYFAFGYKSKRKENVMFTQTHTTKKSIQKKLEKKKFRQG